MFCPNCGSQIPDTATFCPNCGAQIPNAAAQPAAPVLPVEPTQPAEPTNQAPAAEQVPTYQQQAYQAPAAEQVPTYQQQPHQQQAYQQPTYQQAPTQVTPITPSIPKNISMPSVGDLFCGINTQITAYAESLGIQMKWQKAIVVLIYLGVISSLLTAVQYFTGSIYGDSVGSVYRSFPALRFVGILYGLFCLAYAAAMLYARMLLAKYNADGPRFFLLLLLVNGVAAVVLNLLIYVITGVSDFPSLIGQVVGIGVAFYLNKTYYEKRMHLFSE